MPVAGARVYAPRWPMLSRTPPERLRPVSAWPVHGAGMAGMTSASKRCHRRICHEKEQFPFGRACFLRSTAVHQFLEDVGISGRSGAGKDTVSGTAPDAVAGGAPRRRTGQLWAAGSRSHAHSSGARRSGRLKDPQGRYLCCNAAFERIVGFATRPSCAAAPTFRLPGRGGDRSQTTRLLRLAAGRPSRPGCCASRRCMTASRGSSGTGRGWPAVSAAADDHRAARRGRAHHHVGVGADLSRLHEAEQRSHHLRLHDTLTDLPNRQVIAARLTAIETRRAAAIGPAGDAAGHRGRWLQADQRFVGPRRRRTGAGREMSERNRWVAGGQSFGRPGGDESRGDACRCRAGAGEAERATGWPRWPEPIELCGPRGPSPSRSARHFSEDGDSADTLLPCRERCAALAGEGRNTLRRYDPLQPQVSLERLLLLSSLRRGAGRRTASPGTSPSSTCTAASWSAPRRWCAGCIRNWLGVAYAVHPGGRTDRPDRGDRRAHARHRRGAGRALACAGARLAAGGGEPGRTPFRRRACRRGCRRCASATACRRACWSWRSPSRC